MKDLYHSTGIIIKKLTVVTPMLSELLVRYDFLIISHGGCYSLVTGLVSPPANPTVFYQCCSPINTVTSCILSPWINSFNHLYGCPFIHIYWLQYHSIKQQGIKWQRTTEKNKTKENKQNEDTFKLNNYSKTLSLKNFDAPGIAGNSIICLEALVKFYIEYISVKSKLFSFWWKFIYMMIFLNHRK